MPAQTALKLPCVESRLDCLDCLQIVFYAVIDVFATYGGRVCQCFERTAMFTDFFQFLGQCVGDFDFARGCFDAFFKQGFQL